MQNKTTKSLVATSVAALGLTNLSPAQWLAAGAVLSAGAVATPALASAGIPGVGVVVKKKPGNAPIIAPADANGIVRLTGLEPGAYAVSLIGEERVTMLAVGRDGVLTAGAVADDDGSNRQVTALNGPCKPPYMCEVVRGRSVFRSEPFDVKALFSSDLLLPALPRRQQQRLADPVAPKMRSIDVNVSSADDIVRLAPATSLEAAQFIVSERAKAGAIKDPIDFAQRVCPSVGVDFEFASTRMGNAQIIARGGNPKSNGFKCAAQRAGAAPVLSIYNVSYSYVGHVTLLR
jgi:hypothetical protein